MSHFVTHVSLCHGFHTLSQCHTLSWMSDFVEEVTLCCQCHTLLLMSQCQRCNNVTDITLVTSVIFVTYTTHVRDVTDVKIVTDITLVTDVTLAIDVKLCHGYYTMSWMSHYITYVKLHHRCQTFLQIPSYFTHATLCQ